MLDSGTFKTPARPARPRTDRPDVVFVPTVPGAAPPIPQKDEEPSSGPEVDDRAENTPVAPDVPSAPSLETRRDIAEEFTPPPVRGAHAVPSDSEWILTFGDESTAPISGRVLIGRNPARLAGWESASLVSISDPTHSVSKTHAGFEVDDSGLWVHDLASTNGVWVVVGGDATEVATGRRVEVHDGAEIELGDYVLRARRH